MTHEREKSADNGRFLTAYNIVRLKSVVRHKVCRLLSDDFQHVRILSADIVEKLLLDWLTAGSIATTTFKQYDCRDHSGRN